MSEQFLSITTVPTHFVLSVQFLSINCANSFKMSCTVFTITTVPLKQNELYSFYDNNCANGTLNELKQFYNKMCQLNTKWVSYIYDNNCANLTQNECTFIDKTVPTQTKWVHIVWVGTVFIVNVHSFCVELYSFYR